ncbi:MAG: L-threonylcarbamoyladenylate synthase [Myxococcota bacterium]
MNDLSRLVEVLERGGVVACPTETWLGLLADAHNPDAIERVAMLKGRPKDLPIALLAPDAAVVESLCSEPPHDAARALMARYWPGPLTILVPAAPTLSPRLTRDGKVGIRVPGPSPAAALVRAFGGPLTATSANISGQPPVASVEDLPESIRQGLAGEVPGESPGGKPSTLLDMTVSPPKILRAGALSIPSTAL